MVFQFTDAVPPPRVEPEPVSVSAFAVSEFFNVLDVIYLERDGITPLVLEVCGNHESQASSSRV